MATHSFKDLVVWQKAMSLVEVSYGICEKLPKHETYALSDQIRRSSVSVPSNIAEGQKRINKPEMIQFLGIALGSVAEVETQLILAERLYSINTKEGQELCEEIAKMMTAMIRTLKAKI